MPNAVTHVLIPIILIDIFRDDELCKQTLKTEIELYQKNNLCSN